MAACAFGAKHDEKQKRRLAVAVLCIATVLVIWGLRLHSEHERDRIERFFLDHARQTYHDRMGAEEVHFVGCEKNWAVVYGTGQGPVLTLYQFDSRGDLIQILGSTTGEIAISGGMSINHVESDGRHVYFGTLSDRHWEPGTDAVVSLPWNRLDLTDGAGDTTSVSVKNNGFLCVLDTPMSDFQLLDKEKIVVLDYATYLRHEYVPNECEIIETDLP